MSVIDEPGRRSGGLGLVRATLIVARGNVFLIAIVVFFTAAAFARGAVELGLVGVGLAAVAFAFATALALATKPGVRVTEADQPILYALVAGVAAAGGLRPPDRIWLRGNADIRAHVPDWRRDLQLGRAAMDLLTEVELRAMVAHELAVLAQPRAYLVTRLVELSADVDDHLWDPDVTANRRKHRLATRLAPAVAPVHAVADAAGVRAAGSSAAFARALAVTDAASGALVFFRYGSLELPRAGRLRQAAILDVDDGLRRALAADGESTTFGDYAAALLAHRHPLVRAELTELGRHDLYLTPTPSLLRPLRTRDQRMLARAALGLRSNDSVRWTTFADAPEHWWRTRADKGAADVRRRAARVLGRAPVDDAEALAAAHRGAMADIAANPAITPEPGWLDQTVGELGGQLDVVECAALSHGWRLAHPAVRGVLVGPAGQTLDAHTLVDGTIGEPDVRRLRAVLAALAAGSDVSRLTAQPRAGTPAQRDATAGPDAATRDAVGPDTSGPDASGPGGVAISS